MWGIIEGIAHPIVGFDHALAMVAVGIMAASLGGRALWVVPAAFLAVMALGAVLAANRIDLPHYEVWIALSVIVLGAILAAGRNLPLTAAAGVAGFFALFHGYAHGAEPPLEASFAAYTVGFLLSTALLHAVGIGLEFGARRIGPPTSVRVRQFAGIGMVVFGIALLAGWL